jgi:N-acetyltransferase 10
MSLYVSSHYKNTPNDLQLMSDGPGQLLFVLLGPIDENTTSLPDIFCVIQIALEGNISKGISESNFVRGELPSGDLIPYIIMKQFQELDFGGLSGGRIVRIATHPDYQKMGYGTKALQLLIKYYQGEIFDLNENLDEKIEESEKKTEVKEKEKKSTLLNENIEPKDSTKLPPLLQSLEDRKPEKLNYLGTSYGLTKELYSFWKKNGLLPVYIRLSENETTGEHTCVMIKEIKENEKKMDDDWLNSFNLDFKNRFLSLLSYEFSKFESGLVLNILDFQSEEEILSPLTYEEMDFHFSKFDLKRLTSYSKNLVDYHVILDLIPLISRLYFNKKLQFNLSLTQASILISLGLQHKEIGKLDLGIASNQSLAQFNKIIKKFITFLNEVEKTRIIKSNKKIKNEIKMIKSEPNIKNMEDFDKYETKIKNEKEQKLLEEDDELAEIFGKPNKIETNEKKRNHDEIIENEKTDVEKEKNQKKMKLISEELLKNDKYKIKVSNIDLNTNLTKHNSSISTLSTVGNEEVKSNKNEKIQKFMLKGDKEKDEENKSLKNKLFKKGTSSKKRNIKE